MQYVDDLRNASAAEIDEAEADWRDTVECMYVSVTECENVPTPEELDDLDVDTAISTIDQHVDEAERAANDWIADTTEWGKVAKARIEAKRKIVKAEA